MCEMDSPPRSLLEGKCTYSQQLEQEGGWNRVGAKMNGEGVAG